MDKLSGRVSLISIILIISGILIVSLGIFMANYEGKKNVSNAYGITKEAINSVLQEYATSSENDENYGITVTDTDIKVTENGKEYSLKYDLKDKPTFSFEFPVSQGMSYSDYKDYSDKMELLFLGYVAIARIKGVNLEDAVLYFRMMYISTVLSTLSQYDNLYVIFDDTKIEEGANVTVSSSTNKIIYASKFGEKAMEYVNSLYGNPQVYDDSTNDGINSFSITTSQKDVTDTSCKVVSTLVVDPEANFSKLNGFTEELENSFSDMFSNFDTSVSQ